jgi:hypothetical protein
MHDPVAWLHELLCDELPPSYDRLIAAESAALKKALAASNARVAEPRRLSR